MKRVTESSDHVAKLEALGVAPNYLGPAAFPAAWADIETRFRPVLEAVAQEKK